MDNSSSTGNTVSTRKTTPSTAKGVVVRVSVSTGTPPNVTWNGPWGTTSGSDPDLDIFSGKSVRFRFEGTNSSDYSVQFGTGASSIFKDVTDGSDATWDKVYHIKDGVSVDDSCAISLYDNVSKKTINDPKLKVSQPGGGQI